MSWFLELLYQSEEWQNGYLTLLFLVITMVLTVVLQLPGTWAQWRTVRDPKQSIDDLDTSFLLALGGYFTVFLIYSLWVHSIGGVFNVVVLGPVLWAIAAKLYKRRGFNGSEIDLFGAISGLVFVSMIFPTIAYTIASLGLMLFPIRQVNMIRRERNSIGVNPKLPGSYAIVCVVWSIYGFLMHDYFIGFVAGTFIFLYGGIVVACRKYPAVPQPAPI